MLVSPAPYTPFLDPQLRRTPGLIAMPPESWIEIDAAYAAQMAYRDQLIVDKGEAVAAMLPEGAAAVAELSELVAAHVLTHFSNQFQLVDGGIKRPDGVIVDLEGGVAALGRIVQEDFCLLTRHEGALEHRLVAANLCFPSRWTLSEKLGCPLVAIHAPVPDYAGELASRVERVHAALHTDRPLQRFNALVTETPELYLTGGAAERRVPREPGEGRFYLRVERQTLRRLPKTRAVAFGIKTYVSPIETLDAAARAALAEELQALPAAMVGYKGGSALVGAAVAALRGGPEARIA